MASGSVAASLTLEELQFALNASDAAVIIPALERFQRQIPHDDLLAQYTRSSPRLAELFDLFSVKARLNSPRLATQHTRVLTSILSRVDERALVWQRLARGHTSALLRQLNSNHLLTQRATLELFAAATATGPGAARQVTQWLVRQPELWSELANKARARDDDQTHSTREPCLDLSVALLRNADAPTRVLLSSPKGVLGALLRKLPHDRAYIAARVLDALRECLIDEARARARARAAERPRSPPRMTSALRPRSRSSRVPSWPLCSALRLRSKRCVIFLSATPTRHRRPRARVRARERAALVPRPAPRAPCS